MTGFVQRHRVGLLASLLVLAYVFLLGGGIGSQAAKLSEVQTNTNASYLSKSAESTRALNVQSRFLAEDQVPAVVLYERDTAITAADTARAIRDLQLIRNHHDWLSGTPSPPIPSADGKALVLYLPFDGKDSDAFISNVDAAREIVERPGAPAGLRVYMTGLGGISADLYREFSTLDGKLFLAAGVVVIVILLLVYRSPVLWVLPVLGALISLGIASGLLYLLAKADIITVNGQSQGIFIVLTVGAATDYALLLVARYREELHLHERPWDAMKVAWRSAAPAVVASAATVILALLCMLVSELEGNKGLGPVAAVGVASAVLTQLVLLPAMLLAGRWLFWPRIPRLDGQDPVHEGAWASLAARLGRRPMQYSVATGLALVVLALATFGLKAEGLSQSEQLTTRPPSVVGQEHLARHFSAGTGTPVDIVGPAADVEQIVATARGVKGVASVLPFAGDAVFNGPPKVVDGQVLVEATLSPPADSAAAEAVVKQLRTQLDAVSKDVLVGGFTAINSDIMDASRRDNRVIIPLVLVLITGVLAVLLRSLVAPLLLIATVVLSFTATLGACALAFNHLFDFPGADPAFPLFAFVFLVGLGVDYNIFLMTRVREEAKTHPTGEAMQRGLTVTGGVITSAGIVLAATFAVLATLPLISFAQVGFAVAFGVVLDTFVVRSLLVPALTLLLGERVWWPARAVDNR